MNSQEEELRASMTQQHRFYLWEFLVQLLVTPISKLIESIKKNLCGERVEFLEECWKQDYIELLERCWNKDCE
ncbi:MAG: hypothetical protein HC862_17060 [Scytonema sp. RU_4_4]|nr:hypothetical protein [Scytonema sp. RU_4_4]